MPDEFLLAVDGAESTIVPPTSLSALELHERAHLQEWVLRHPEMLGEGAVVITSEFNRWQTSEGLAVHDRLDVLALGLDGRLIVAELKRGTAPASIHMQAISYAAMCSRLTLDYIADLYAETQKKAGQVIDPAAGLAYLQTTYLLSDDSIKNPRIVLMASAFPPSVTATSVWLGERGVDITLMRFSPYTLGEANLITVSQVFPVPDSESFTIAGRSRSTEAGTVSAEDGAPWDEASLRRLAEQGNTCTLTLLDLCAAEEADGVTVKDIIEQASVTVGQVRGQLAGLSMRLKNPQYGFAQNVWPVKVQWSQDGFASYSMDPALAASWRSIRAVLTASADDAVSASAGGEQIDPPSAAQ